MRTAMLTTALVASASAQHFNILPDHSFKGPFRTFDTEGNRKVPGWRIGGSAEVNEHYVRITNDRQSKKGWLWSEKNWNYLDGWTATLRLRVSGQGKRLFGDGLAFWFTASSDYRPGPAHGFTDTFKGFGIIFDTYVNTDPGHIHKDVLVITNDGSGPKLAPHGGSTDPHPIGCDADFRFFEGRSDFNVTRKSVVKVTFRGNQLSINIDPKGTGEWKECVANIPVAAGSDDWWRAGAWVGVTATTGDLADNHDVLSVLTTVEDEVASEDNVWSAPPVLATGNGDVDRAIASAVERSAWGADEKVSTIQHVLEHKLSRVEDHMKATLRKFQEQEEDLKKRLTELEAALEGRIRGDLGQKLATVHSSISGAVAAQLSESGVSSLGSTTRALGWGVILLAAALAGVSFAAWRKYKHLMKSHLL